MSTPAQHVCPIAFGSGEFEEAVGRVGEALRTGAGMIFLFVGASQEERQDALTKLTAPDELNLHRFRVPQLVAERLVETQGNLREAFDTADESAALLFFDEADVLLDRSRDEAGAGERTEEERETNERADQENAALSDYFFDRVEHYPGVAVVCFSSMKYVDRLEGHSADVVVAF